MKILRVALLILSANMARAENPVAELRVGRAAHAFDHIGGISEQADAAAASGASIIYATGVGSHGYAGLPPEKELLAVKSQLLQYNRNAKEKGVKLSIGYLCATSIVKLAAFDANWSPEFRAQFSTPPAQWLQQDRQGKPLPSWYGGDYNPACMNNPDWQTYEAFLVRQTLETGHDGVFFDNPTIHPQGCYCPHCMKKFAMLLEQRDILKHAEGEQPLDVEAIRKLADAHPKEFLYFRSTISRDFLAQIRTGARAIQPDALITCNNSFNTPDVLFSQSRTYGYNIQVLSEAEDLVVVEDMASQPRTEPGGQVVEYGPSYNLLNAISHGKPVVAVTLAANDYTTPPNLMRLAMAEAAAHGASYLSWPTWPENQRQRMIDAVRPQAEFLRQNEKLLNDAEPRADALLFLPFRRWLETAQCAPSACATALSAANVQYRVISEENFHLPSNGQRRPVFIVESRSVLTPEEATAVQTYQDQGGRVVTADDPAWLAKVQAAIGAPSLIVDGPPTIRAVIQDQHERTVVHLYNLNVQRLSSFEDKVTPAAGIKLTVTVPFAKVSSVSALTADSDGASGPLRFVASPSGENSRVEIQIPRLEISELLVIEP